LTAWILALIALCAPPDAARDRFDEIAGAIDDWAEGDTTLAAELVALAARESHFRPDAVGPDHLGEGYGLFQFHSSNLGVFRIGTHAVITKTSAPLFRPAFATEVAALMVKESHRVCAGRPPEDRLGWYASGGGGCSVPEGLAASRNRTALAAWLLATRPPPPVFYVSRAVDVVPKRATLTP
jgi:hypothetical protein